MAVRKHGQALPHRLSLPPLRERATAVEGLSARATCVLRLDERVDVHNS